MAQTIVKLKLTDAPTETLERLARLCRRGTNAAVEDWLLRHRGKPESAKQAKPSPRTGEALHQSTKLYHAVCAAVPELYADVCAKLSKDLWEILFAKVDWRERVNDTQSTPRRRMHAILEYEYRPPWTTSCIIPALNKNTRLTFGDDLSIAIKNLEHDVPPLTLRVSLKGMPAGLKRILRRIATGDKKLSDSFLTKKLMRDGSEAWFFFLITKADPKESGLPDVSLTLSPRYATSENGRVDRPFKLALPSGGTWFVGDGRYLLAQTMRLTGLRKMIGYRYRYGNGTGHGRKKIDAAVRKRNLQLRNVRDEFRKRLINDIIRQCHRHRASEILYLEPSLPARTLSWFAKRDLEFDWTRFATDLKNSAAKHGLRVTKRMHKIKAVKQEEESDAETRTCSAM